MTTSAFTVPKRLKLVLLALAVWAVPASATIQFTYCTSGCSSAGGDYSSWQTATGSTGLLFSGSPVTFSPGGLSGGVYTDPAGTVFTGYTNSVTTTALQVSGSTLAQTGSGTNTWEMNIALPANTYAFSMVLSSASFSNPWVELVSDPTTFNFGNANYNMVLGGGGATAFFGVISDTAITNIVVGNLSNGNPFTIQSFEEGDNSPTPESSSLILIGGGLALLGLIRRRSVQKPHRSLA